MKQSKSASSKGYHTKADWEHVMSEVRSLRKMASKPAHAKQKQKSVRMVNGPRERQSRSSAMSGVSVPELGPGEVRLRQPFKEQFPSLFPGSTGFLSATISVNPGDVTIFSRLAAVAKLYTYWRFVKLRIMFIPEGSAFAANNQTGEVCLNFLQDWFGSAPGSMQIARARLPSKAGNAWVPVVLDVPAKLLKTWRFVRDAAGTAGADPRLYDFAVAFSIQNTPNASSVGYLSFEGEVEFGQEYVPNAASAVIATWQNRLATWLSNAAQTLVSGVTTNLNLAAPIFPINVLGQGMGLVSYSPCNLSLAPGTYKMTTVVQVTATTITQAILTLPNIPGVAYQASPSAQWGNSTFSAGLINLSRIDVIVVPEAITAGLQNICPQVNVSGTGTINVLTTMILIEQLG